ncbi:MAG: hypothetical protein R3E31_08145 [Chloroflexota bacterium]|nr:hypothetical protein [Anaerolineales bacterium]MCA9977136.1 hypothetical protein [Anaerolineales bacterium]MCB8966915.1 hypothetical protein [Ardenticatenaceae bacterium]MCB8992268.1 hypothetical protein [Ardenticatenaceae bacterium]
MSEHVERESYQYHAYLLRVWREAGQERWKLSLQTTASPQIRYFATLEELVVFLAQLMHS